MQKLCFCKMRGKFLPPLVKTSVFTCFFIKTKNNLLTSLNTLSSCIDTGLRQVGSTSFIPTSNPTSNPTFIPTYPDFLFSPSYCVTSGVTGGVESGVQPFLPHLPQPSIHAPSERFSDLMRLFLKKYFFCNFGVYKNNSYFCKQKR